MADAPFIITTQIDNTQVEAGLKELEVKLRAFNAQVASGSGGAATPPVKPPTVIVPDGKVKTPPVTPVKNLNKEIKSTSNALGDVARRVFIWGSLSALIFGAIQNMREFYNLSLQVNTAMAELKKVLPNETDFAGLQKASFDLSIEFGAEPLDTLQLLKRFGQAGLTAKEAVDATKTALLALNTTGADTEQVFNGIIGANRIFGIQFEASARVINKVQRLQADFAIDSKDLIQSIQGIGPAITVLGGDIDDLFSNIAALGEAARVSGKEAANSLKRVFSRIVSEEGIAALQNLGVTVFETADKFRPLRNILNDLSVTLKTASDVEKQNISVVLAQVRQYSKFIALLNNYERQQEALAKSISASGEAYDANRNVLDTYAKQITIAETKIKQLAESSITSSTGIAGAFTATKIVLGNFAEYLNSAFGGAAVGLVGTTTLLVAGVKGLSAVLPAMNGGLSRTSEVMKRYVKSTDSLGVSLAKGGKALGRYVGSARILTFGLLGAAAAFVILSTIWERVTRDSRLRNAAIDKSADAIKRLKLSLTDLSFGGLDIGVSEGKFTKLSDVLNQLSSDALLLKNNSQEVASAFGKLFLGKSTSLDTEDLQTLLNIVKSLNDTLGSEALAPFFNEIDISVSKAIPSLNDLTKKLEDGYDIFKAYPEGTGLAARSVTDFGKAIDKIRPAGFAGIHADEILSLGLELDKTVDKLIEYSNALKIAEAAGNDTSEKMQAIASAQNNYNTELDKGAKILGKAIDVNAIFEQSLKNLGEAESKAIVSSRNNERAQQYAAVVTKLTSSLRQMATEWAIASGNGSKFALVMKQVEIVLANTLRTAQSSSAGIFAVSINSTALLSAIKKTTAAIEVSFDAQLSSLLAMDKASKNVGVNFKLTEEVVRLAESSMKSLTQAMGANAKDISNLNLEIRTLKNLVTQIKGEAGSDGIAVTDNKQIQKTNTEIARLSLKKASLIAIDQINNQLLESQLKVIADMLKLTTDLQEAQKQRTQGLEAQKKLSELVYKSQVQLNNLKFSDNFKRANIENEKIYVRLLKAQEDFIRSSGEQEGTTQSILDTRIQQLRNDSEIARIEREIGVELAKAEKIYSRIEDGVNSVRSSFSSLLGSTETWFDILATKGSLFELLKRGAKGVGDAIAQADADVIAKALSSKTKGLFGNDAEQLQTIWLNIQGKINELPKKIADPLTDAAALIEAAHIKGLESGANSIDEVVSKLPGLVKEALELLQKEAQVEIDKERKQLEKLSKVLKIPFETKDAQGKADGPFSWKLDEASLIEINKVDDNIKDSFVEGAKEAGVILKQAVVESLGTKINPIGTGGYSGPTIGAGVPITVADQLDAAAAKVNDVADKFNKSVNPTSTTKTQTTPDNTKYEVITSDNILALAELQKKYGDTFDLLKEISVFDGVSLKLDENEIKKAFDSAVSKTDNPWVIDASNIAAVVEQLRDANEEGILQLGNQASALISAADTSLTSTTSALLKTTVDTAAATFENLKLPEFKIDSDSASVLKNQSIPAGTNIGDKQNSPTAGDNSRVVDGLQVIGVNTRDTNRALFSAINSINDQTLTLAPLTQTQTEAIQAFQSGNKSVLDIHTQYLASISDNTGEAATNTGNPSESGMSDNDRAVLNAGLRRVATMSAQAIGYAIAKNNNKRPEDVAAGSNLGSLAGGIVGSVLNNAFLGSMLGGAFGSILGGIFGRKKEADPVVEELVKIEKNTASLVDKLTAEIINAPTGFSLPSSTGFGGSPVIQNNITISGGASGLDNSTVRVLETQLQDIYNRTSTSQSALR